jgi:hypothetical protein
MGDISRRQYMSIESSLEMDPHFRMYGPFLNGVGDGGSRNGSDWAKDAECFGYQQELWTCLELR